MSVPVAGPQTSQVPVVGSGAAETGGERSER